MGAGRYACAATGAVPRVLCVPCHRCGAHPSGFRGCLTFSGGRSGGYQAFLALLKPFIRNIADYTIAQRSFTPLTVLVLGYELLRSFSSLTIALVCEVALLFNPEVNRYHFSILTESLYLSTSALFLGRSAFVFAYGPIQIIGYGVRSRCVRGNRSADRPRIAAFARHTPARWTTFVVASHLESYSYRGGSGYRDSLARSIHYREHNAGPRETLAPIHLLAKSGMVEATGPETIISMSHPDTQPLQRAEVSLSPVRGLIAGAPNQAARCKLIANYEVFVQYQFAPDERAIATAQGSSKPLLDAALGRLENAVGDYIRLTTDHLQCLWSLGAATKQSRQSSSPISKAGDRFPLRSPCSRRWLARVRRRSRLPS